MKWHWQDKENSPHFRTCVRPGRNTSVACSVEHFGNPLGKLILVFENYVHATEARYASTRTTVRGKMHMCCAISDAVLVYRQECTYGQSGSRTQHHKVEVSNKRFPACTEEKKKCSIWQPLRLRVCIFAFLSLVGAHTCKL